MQNFRYTGGIAALSEMLGSMSEEHDAEAAVALLLKPSDGDLQALFVKRVDTPNDPWSGQMALPGGKRDTKDQNLRQTVIRETLEETNINLKEDCRFLGLIDPQRSIRKPEMRVLPFVVLLEHEPLIRLNAELEGFIWISLQELARNRRVADVGYGKFPAYVVSNVVIWGLTYRILEEFFHILAGENIFANER